MMAEFHFELNYPFNNLILLKFTHICTCPSTHTHTFKGKTLHHLVDCIYSLAEWLSTQQRQQGNKSQE